MCTRITLRWQPLLRGSNLAGTERLDLENNTTKKNTTCYIQSSGTRHQTVSPSSERAMATISAAAVFAVARPSQAHGLPQLRARAGKVRCGACSKQQQGGNGKGAPPGASLLAAASAMTTASPAMALVDERMSTEGTGLSLGLSNNLLGWILLGVFGLIWSLYTVYTSTLDEDEDSGLSL